MVLFVRPSLYSLLALCLSTVWSACTPSAVLDDVDTSPARIAALEGRVAADSSDVVALRDLGSVYVVLDQFQAATSLLKQAFTLDPEDLSTRYYYGLSLEHTDQLDEALRLYEHYRGLPRRSRFRRLLAERHATTNRELVRRDIRNLIAAENSPNRAPLDVATKANTVAVFPLYFQGGDSSYAPLGRGLSTLIMRDLTQVEGLTVLERIRLDVLLAELELSESGAVDPASAPRVGWLLQARRIIGGRFSIVEGDQISLQLAIHEVVAEETEDLPMVDQLKRFYDLEKDLVFRLITEMGIELTESERRAIEYIPTRDLQAFLAYSRGLQAQDAGLFATADRYFREAVRLDPGFSEAAEQAGIDDALLDERQQKLLESTGALILPGQDRRDEGPGGVVPIGRPPDPPTSGGN